MSIIFGGFFAKKFNPFVSALFLQMLIAILLGAKLTNELYIENTMMTYICTFSICIAISISIINWFGVHAETLPPHVHLVSIGLNQGFASFCNQITPRVIFLESPGPVYFQFGLCVMSYVCYFCLERINS